MKDHRWNIGFYNNDGVLINDIPLWSKSNILVIDDIKPIIWFGPKNHIFKVWSISIDTSDEYIKSFWTEFYDGALNHICKADSGIGMYYTICEYGIEYNDNLFEHIKQICPINLNNKKEDRITSLNNLIISIYNENKIL